MKKYLALGIFVLAMFPTSTYAYNITTVSSINQDFTGEFESGSIEKFGQTFLTVGAGHIDSITVRQKQSGSPTMNVTAHIYATASDVPTGSSLGDSASINAAALPSDCSTDVTYTFGSSIDLASGTLYAVVFTADGYSSTNNVTSCGANNSQYASGRHFFAPTQWTLANSIYDLYVSVDVLSGGGGGGVGNTSAIITWLMILMVFTASVLFLVLTANGVETFLAGLSPARFLSNAWGRRTLRKKLWK